MQEVGWLVQGKHIPGKVKLSIQAYPPDKRKRDLSNIIKVLEDALVRGGLIEDDSLIDDLHITRHEKGGYVLITVDKIS